MSKYYYLATVSKIKYYSYIPELLKLVPPKPKIFPLPPPFPLTGLEPPVLLTLFVLNKFPGVSSRFLLVGLVLPFHLLVPGMAAGGFPFPDFVMVP